MGQNYSKINLQKENEALILYLKQQGAFTGLEIKHLAACKIQQYWRRYRRDREMKIQQFLMLKHESLRRDKDSF